MAHVKVEVANAGDHYDPMDKAVRVLSGGERSRLLVLRTEGGTERLRYLDVVLNWFPEMRRTLDAQGATADR